MRLLLLRLGRALAVMAGISALVFLIFFATPGADPAARIAGRGAGPETLAAVRAEFGLDQALPVQYVRLMERLFVSRDLASYANRGQLVVPTLLGAAPVTLSLVAGAAVLWGALGLAIGLAAALRRTGRPSDADRAAALEATDSETTLDGRLAAYRSVFFTTTGSPRKDLCTKGAGESLRERLDDATLRRLGLAWAVVSRVSPTRPHPTVARRPPGNALSGLPLSVLDRSRDHLDAIADSPTGSRGRTAPVARTLSAALARAAG